MIPTKEKYIKALPELKKTLGVNNSFALPKLVKVIVSTGTGSIKDRAKMQLIPDRIAQIVGQKPAVRQAKKSIASFKVRQGDPAGQVVTLRGERMYQFLDKLINIAIPRQRDFRGIDPKCIDQMGNLTLGFKEHTVFPETADEELRNVFGFSVIIVTTAKDKKSARVLFDSIGIPFKK